MRRLAAFLIPIGLAAAQAVQPAGPAAVPSFESASVKPSSPDANSSGVDSDPGLLRIQNQTLHGLVRIAYGVNDSQVTGGPKWAEADRFDVIGKAGGPADSPELLKMMQALLTERFKLEIHREARTVTGFALVAAKSGVKMQAASGGESTSHGSRGQIDAKGVSMSTLAGRLSRLLHAPVEDQTGATGGFNFTLKWNPDDPALRPMAADRPSTVVSDSKDPSLFAALQEQLGLKLESRKVQMEMIVIDGAQKPGEN